MSTPDNNTDKQKLSQLMDGEWLGINAADCVAKLCDDDELRRKWMRYHMIRDAMKSEPLQAQPDLASRICAAIDDEPVYSNITPFSGGQSDKQSPWAQSPVSDVDNSAASASPDESEQPPAAAFTDQQGATALRNTEPKTSWVNTGVAGFALAASVAVVTVVGMNLVQQQQNVAGVPAIAGSAIGPDGAALVTPQVFASTDSANAFSRQDKATTLPVVEFVANTGSYWVTPTSAERVSDEDRLNMMLSQHIENSPTSVREGLLPYSRLVGYDENRPER